MGNAADEFDDDFVFDNGSTHAAIDEEDAEMPFRMDATALKPNEGAKKTGQFGTQFGASKGFDDLTERTIAPVPSHIVPHYRRGELARLTVPENQRVDATISDFRHFDLENHFGKERIRRYGGFLAKKYIPPTLTDEQLFDETTQIRAGPQFEEQFGDHNNHLIWTMLGDGTRPMISSFDECNFHPVLRANMARKGYNRPTHVQKALVPIIQRKGQDVMVQAQTGSGKTAAYLLPIVDDVIRRMEADQRCVGKVKSPYAVIMGPTRELVEQLGKEAKAFCAGTCVKVFVNYGDTSMVHSLKTYNEGCDIMVTTAGRLVHFLGDRLMTLDRLAYLVLDEGDRLFQDRFHADLLTIREKYAAPNYRTIFLSATISAEASEQAAQLLNPDYFIVKIDFDDHVAETIQQRFIVARQTEKARIVRDMLIQEAKRSWIDANGETNYEVPRTVVFCDKRRTTDRVALYLSLWGIKAISSNGNRNQWQRANAQKAFHSGAVNVMVATNVVARGLNFADIMHVINFDLPKDIDTYVHRIGRTGRAGNVGIATSLFNPTNPDDLLLTPDLIKSLESCGHEVPEVLQACAARLQQPQEDAAQAKASKSAQK